MTIVLVIAALALLALVTALIAHRKGRGFWTFYVFGLLAWIIAVPVVVLMDGRRADA